MFRKELITHSLITFIYFTFISLFNFHLGFSLLFLWFGALLGTFLLDLDHVLIALDKENKTWWAEKFRFLWQKRKYKEAIFHLAESHLEHSNLVFHSVLFQPVLLIIAFFVLTSTGSLLGSGLVMSMNLHLLKDEWHSFLAKGEIGFLFWQIKKKIDRDSQRVYLIVATSLFFLLSLLLA